TSGPAGVLVTGAGDGWEPFRVFFVLGGMADAFSPGPEYGRVPFPSGLAGGPAHLRVVQPEAPPGDPARRRGEHVDRARDGLALEIGRASGRGRGEHEEVE